MRVLHSAETPERERGAAMVFALAFVVVASGIVLGLASLSMAGLKMTSVTRSVTHRTFANDGGIEYGIERLRADPSICPTLGAGRQHVGSLELNGYSVDVACRLLVDGSGSGSTSPSFVATGYDYGSGNSPVFDQLIHLSNDTGEKVLIDSWAYNAGGFTFAGAHPELRLDNQLDQRNPHCAHDRNNGITPVVTGAWSCQPASTDSPDPDPEVWVPATPAPAPHTIGGCTIFFPGRYTNTGWFSFNSAGSYYFASGVYYFDDIGEVQFQGVSFGGQPANGEERQTVGTVDNPIAPCADDNDANAAVRGSATGKGITFVLGGSSRLKVANGPLNMVEFHSRQSVCECTEGGLNGYSVVTPKADGIGSNGAAYSRSTSEAAFITDSVDGGVVVHGVVYVPTSKLKIWGLPNLNAPGGFIFGSGLITSSIEIATSDLSGVVRFAKGPSAIPAPETFLVTASTDHRTTSAVVTLASDGQVAIDSWRANEVSP